MNEQLEELRSAFERFERIPFPSESKDEEVSLLRADLALFDSHVAGLTQQLLAGARVPSSLFAADEQLNSKLNKLLLRRDWKSSEEGVQYLNYLRSLETIMELAQLASS